MAVFGSPGTLRLKCTAHRPQRPRPTPDPELAHRNDTERPLAADPLSQALVVAIWRYQHVPDLQPAHDVQGMRGVFASAGHCTYPPDRATVLQQEQETRANLLDALNLLRDDRATSPSWRTFFYFSGHGGQSAG